MLETLCAPKDILILGCVSSPCHQGTRAELACGTWDTRPLSPVFCGVTNWKTARWGPTGRYSAFGLWCQINASLNSFCHISAIRSTKTREPTIGPVPGTTQQTGQDLQPREEGREQTRQLQQLLRTLEEIYRKWWGRQKMPSWGGV